MDPKVVELISDFVGTGFGALFGAWCAFRFERRHKGMEEKAEQLAGIRQALFALIIQKTFLENFVNLYLSPQKDRADRWLTLQKYLTIPLEQDLSLERISFLMEFRASNLLNQLALGQHQFRTFLGVLDARNNALQATLDRLTVVRRTTEVKPQDLESALGPEVVEPLRRLTDGLYEAASIAQEANEEDIRGIQTFFSETFPDEHLPQVYIHPATASR